MTFQPASRNQLSFNLQLTNQKLNRTYLTYASSPDERFFGFGEQFSFFDLKGRRLPIFVMEQGIGRGAEPITTGANLQAYGWSGQECHLGASGAYDWPTGGTPASLFFVVVADNGEEVAQQLLADAAHADVVM